MSENKPEIIASDKSEFEILEKFLHNMPPYLRNSITMIEHKFDRVFVTMMSAMGNEQEIRVPRSLIQGFKFFKDNSLYIYFKDYTIQCKHSDTTKFSLLIVDDVQCQNS